MPALARSIGARRDTGVRSPLDAGTQNAALLPLTKGIARLSIEGVEMLGFHKVHTEA